jgi:TPP-dependent 2-oxoacid decarboxylase
MVGDGALSMLLGELITVVQYDLPVQIVVFDNATLGMVRLEMLVDGLPSYATDSPAVDYAALASSLGIPSTRVTGSRRRSGRRYGRRSRTTAAPWSTWSPTRARCPAHRRPPPSRSPGSPRR